jgi:hypothetical protein
MFNRRKLLLNYATRYFKKDKERIRRMINITTRRRGVISLRMIEFFLSNFIKNNQNTVLDKKNLTGEEVTRSYNRHLKAYSKTHFDLFCRKEKCMHKITFGTETFTIQTNDAQMLFFNWFLSLDLDKVMMRHIKELQSQINEETISTKESMMWKKTSSS